MYIWHLLARIYPAFVLVLSAGAGAAASAPSSACEQAAQFAAERTGVPVSIMQAVTLAETGQTRSGEGHFAPWPWAVQADNKGHWFKDQQSAISFTESLTAQGKSNIDIGCFQINIYWHSKAFRNLDQMFSPKDNALYAATFLQKLYQQTGDWRAAVGRYHSRDSARAEAYLERLETLFARHVIGPASLQPEQPQAAPPPQKEPEKFGLVSARGPLVQFSVNHTPLIGGSR